jgi:hypothetical protein
MVNRKQKSAEGIAVFSVRLPQELARAVQSEADRESRYRNNMIQVLLKEALQHRQAASSARRRQGSTPDDTLPTA